MRVILKHKSTELYFRGEGVWVESDQEAHVFTDVTNAFQYCTKNQLKDTQIVLKFGSGIDDLSLNPPIALETV